MFPIHRDLPMNGFFTPPSFTVRLAGGSVSLIAELCVVRIHTCPSAFSAAYLHTNLASCCFIPMSTRRVQHSYDDGLCSE